MLNSEENTAFVECIRNGYYVGIDPIELKLEFTFPSGKKFFGKEKYLNTDLMKQPQINAYVYLYDKYLTND